jgi:hypothetical protein
VFGKGRCEPRKHLNLLHLLIGGLAILCGGSGWPDPNLSLIRRLRHVCANQSGITCGYLKRAYARPELRARAFEVSRFKKTLPEYPLPLS